MRATLIFTKSIGRRELRDEYKKICIRHLRSGNQKRTNAIARQLQESKLHPHISTSDWSLWYSSSWNLSLSRGPEPRYHGCSDHESRLFRNWQQDWIQSLELHWQPLPIFFPRSQHVFKVKTSILRFAIRLNKSVLTWSSTNLNEWWTQFWFLMSWTMTI